MNHISKLIAIGIVLSICLAAWMFRWSVIPTENGTKQGDSYLLDRWTGKVYVLDLNHQILVYPYP